MNVAKASTVKVLKFQRLLKRASRAFSGLTMAADSFQLESSKILMAYNDTIISRGYSATNMSRERIVK